jgi:predicted permease
MANWLTKLGRRLRLAANRDGVEREMRDEMAFHVENEARWLELNGVPPEEARRMAVISFGGSERHKEEARDSRGGRWFTDLFDDLAQARRQIVRSPAAILAMVLVLGAGVAGAGLVFSAARAYLLKPLPVPEADRLAFVIPAASRNPSAITPDLRGVDWKVAAAGFDATAAWDLDGFTLVGGAAPEYVDGAWVSPGYFEVLGARVIRGRPFGRDEYQQGNRVAIISSDLWARRFGSADSVVGSAVRLHSTDRPLEQELVTIVGVLAPQAWRLNRFQDLLRPLGDARRFSLARVPEGTSFEASAARLTARVRSQLAAADTGWRMSLVPALDEHVYLVRPVLRVLMGLAALLLLLSTASVGALLIARGEERGQEMAVRQALGATGDRLARQVATEVGMIWALATALGVALTAALARVMSAGIEGMAGITVPGGLASVGLDATTIAFIMVASAVPFAVLGFAPLLRVMRQSGGVARPGARVAGSRGASGTRRGLVTVQVTLAVALMINAALLLKTVRGMENASLGFVSANLLKAHLLLPRTRYPDAAARLRGASAILAGTAAAPGVAGAAIVHPHPFRGTESEPVECRGCGTGNDVAAFAAPQTVSPSYFETLSIPIVGGRGFDSRDVAGGQPVAIVSRELAERWGGTQATLGREVRVQSLANDGAWLTIVGVAGEVRKTFGDTLVADLYVPLAQNPRAYFAMLVRTQGSPAASVEPIRRALAGVDEALALSDVESMDDVIRARSGGQRFLATFASGSAALALALTACALYAVIMYLTFRRRREFAVRIAIGAHPRSLVSLVMREGATLLLRGLLAGVALAALGGLLVRSLLFGVTAFDLPAYALSALAVALVAGLALSVPALRASRLSPTAALRDEG